MKMPHIYSDQFKNQPDQVARLFNNIIDEINNLSDGALLDRVYPVNSVYMSTESDPAVVSELLGGEWERYGVSTAPYMFIRVQ